MKTISTDIANFLNFCRQGNSTYDIYSQDLEKCDKATQDLLHQLELGSYKDRQRTATKLAKVRQARRIYKDYVEVYGPLYEFLHKPENEKFIKFLQEVLGETRRQERRINCRSYKPKVIKDLDFLNSD